MWLGTLACLAISALTAQVMPPVSPDANGVVLERDSGPAGEFSVRLDSFEVVRYRFDAATRVARDNYPIGVPLLKPGERVAVLSDAEPGSLLRRARTVTVIASSPQARHTRNPNALPPLDLDSFELDRLDFGDGAFEDPLFARGELSLSGVVASVNGSRMVLHTRDGERTILLRQDTRYLDNGETASVSSLRPNMRVSVRAGRNIYNEVEGYQVVWGSILEPK
jgi:hypothetical protein